MLSPLGPVGVPNESRYWGPCSVGGRAPKSLTTSGARTATRIRRTMKTAAASATRSFRRRRQKSCRGERAAIAGCASRRSAPSPPGASRTKSTLPVRDPPRVQNAEPFDDRSRTPRDSGELRPHPLERAADQAGDVHLGYAHPLGDLRLSEPVLEPHAEDLALSLGERRERRLERRAVVGAVELRILRADRLHRVELVLARRPDRERERRVCRPGLERLQHLLGAGLELRRYLRDAGRAPQLRREPLDGRPHLPVQLLEGAGHPDRPALVAEVALDLPHHVRRRVRREGDLARQLVAVDRLDQPDRADLLDVLERLAAAGVAARQGAHERQVPLHEHRARARVAALVVAAQQLAVGLGGMLDGRHGERTSFSSRSTASWRSSSWSKPRSSRSAMPPSTMRMTASQAGPTGAVSSMRSDGNWL